MQKGFIWTAFFQRSEIWLVLARNTLISVSTQESVLLLLYDMHLRGRSRVMEKYWFFWWKLREKMFGTSKTCYKFLLFWASYTDRGWGGWKQQQFFCIYYCSTSICWFGGGRNVEKRFGSCYVCHHYFLIFHNSQIFFLNKILIGFRKAYA